MLKHLCASSEHRRKLIKTSYNTQGSWIIHYSSIGRSLSLTEHQARTSTLMIASQNIDKVCCTPAENQWNQRICSLHGAREGISWYARKWMETLHRFMIMKTCRTHSKIHLILNAVHMRIWAGPLTSHPLRLMLAIIVLAIIVLGIAVTFKHVMYYKYTVFLKRNT